MNQWISDVINSPKRIAIPILTHPGIEMIGKTVLDAVTDGKVHAEAIKALNERYPSDTKILCCHPVAMFRHILRSKNVEAFYEALAEFNNNL